MSVLRDKANFRVLSIASDIAGKPLGIGSSDDQMLFDKWVGPNAPYPTCQAQIVACPTITFCNEFAGSFLRSLTGVYGSFDMRSYVMPIKPYAWIDAESIASPKVGDILQYSDPFTHLGVARAALSSGYSAVYNGVLYKVEAGQGGVHYGQDFLNVTTSSFPARGLLGWLDIDLWEYGPDYSDDEDGDLSALNGIWTVWGDNRRYRWVYTFDAGSASVTWRDVFNGETGRGRFAFVGGRLKIAWNSGTVDLWDLPVDANGTTGMEMSGSDAMDLYATKP